MHTPVMTGSIVGSKMAVQYVFISSINIADTPAPALRSTITVDPDAPLSSAEQANSGTLNYTFTASCSGNCSGPASGEINQMQIRFEGNWVILTNGNQQSQFAKVDENNYQASDGVDIVTMTFTEDGFTGESQCVFWTYTRRKKYAAKHKIAAWLTGIYKKFVDKLPLKRCRIRHRCLALRAKAAEEI